MMQPPIVSKRLSADIPLLIRTTQRWGGAQMSFKIKYTSRRREVWDYYRGALRHQKNANIESTWNFKTIVKHSVQRSWADIDSVSEEGSHIIILGRNGNAFIVATSVRLDRGAAELLTLRPECSRGAFEPSRYRRCCGPNCQLDDG